MIFWINIPLGLAALTITTFMLRRLPRYERPHRLDIIGAMLIVVASVSFMLALNLGGDATPGRRRSCSPCRGRRVVAGLFVLRLVTAPEPLIPISILTNPIVRHSIATNSFGWGRSSASTSCCRSTCRA